MFKIIEKIVNIIEKTPRSSIPIGPNGELPIPSLPHLVAPSEPNRDTAGSPCSNTTSSPCSKSLSSRTSLPQYTLSEVSQHCHHNDCWLIIYDKVYDVTDFVDSHPGGGYIVMENAGRDVTLMLRASRHSKDAYDMIKKYLIGILVEYERLYIPSDEVLELQTQH